MHPALEVAVAREDRRHVQVPLVDRAGDLLDQGARVPDAGRAAVPDEREAQLVEVRRQPGAVEVVGHDARPRCQGRLHPWLRLQARLDRLAGEQSGGEHHARVRGVRARRDRRDHDRAVPHLALVGGLVHPVVAGEALDPDVPALGHVPADLGGLRVGLGMVPEGRDERVPHLGEGDPVLRPLGAGERGHDRREVELENLAEGGLGVAVGAEQPLLLRVALDEVDPVVAAREREVPERLGIHREVRGGRPVLGTHVREGRAVRDRERGQPVAEELDERADDAVGSEHLRERQDEVGRGRSRRQGADGPHADHHRPGQEHRLAEHRGLGLDPADAPSEHAQPVDHRGVRVGADHRVGEGHAIALAHDLAEVLEVHLVADPRARRHHAEAVERLLRPAEQRVPLGVAPVLELDVALVRLGGPEQVDLYRVVDHEIDRDQRVHRRRVSAGARGGAPHRGEVDDGRHAREVLHQHAARHEGHVAGRSRPGRERAHVVVGDVARARATEQVLEEDAHGVREAGDVADAVVGEPPESVEVDGAGGGLEPAARARKVAGQRGPSVEVSGSNPPMP